MSLPAVQGAVGAQQIVNELTTAGVLTPTALTLDRDLDYDTTEAVARALGEIDRYYRQGSERASWWVGDFLIYAEKAHGDLFAQIAEATKLAPQTLLNRMSICRAIPPSQRREGVNFSVHAEVAYLATSERAELLRAAADEGLTRDEIRARKKGAKELPPAVEHERCPTCGQEIKT